MPHCVIIGAGVVGLATAYELIARRFSVTLIDNALVGAASSVAGGILSPLYPWRAPTPINALAQRSQKIYQRLFATGKVDQKAVGARQCGALYLDTKELGAAQTWCNKQHYSIETFDHLKLRKTEPGLNLKHAFCLPHVWQVDPVALLNLLRQTLNKEPAVQFLHKEVAKIEYSATRVSGLRLKDNALISADLVVACCGAWTRELLPSAKIYPVRGQMLEFDTIAQQPKHVIISDNNYLIPRRDAKLLVGSTIENVGFDATTTAAAKSHLYDFACHIMPELANHQPLSHHAGLRPGTCELPIIGRFGSASNLFVNSGHFRNGVTLAPASAELITQIICGETPTLNPNPFDPNTRE